MNGDMPFTPTTSTPTTAAADPLAALTSQFTLKRAVSYLRVSTREQAERGGREEGFSIPAQHEANNKKAAAMGAKVVKEFVERGASGTTTKRPALQEMLRYLDDEGDSIDYVIVHKLDRLARNRADDVAITQRFDAHSIRLVSTSENIDQTPGGMLLHGIMSSIAEFYSRNLAGEVVKGMTQKAQSGGIITRAPLGYLNTRRITNGREERTATIDEERAPLIRWAFEAYATGNWSLKTLTAELNRRGLTTLATASTASNPVQVRTVHGILTNPFYAGVVNFQGASYPGQHTGLVDPAVFETVQTVLRGKFAGERVITHDHYVKSTLFCGQCGFRMIVQVTTNRHGTTYPYYACLGRHSKRTQCTLRSIQIDHVEDLITDLCERIALTDEFRTALESLLRARLKLLRKDTDSEREHLHQAKLSIQRRQRKLLEAHYNDAIGIDMLRTEQQQLTTELNATTRHLDALSADYTEADRLITQALDLVQHCAKLYRVAPEHVRRMLNQTLFKRIDVIEDTDGTHHIEVTYNEPYRIFFSASTRDLVAQTRPAVQTSEPQTHEEPAVAGGLSLNLLSDELLTRVSGSSKSIVVEVAGIEPASDDVEPGLLRAQSAAAFLGPRAHADKTRTGPVT